MIPIADIKAQMGRCGLSQTDIAHSTGMSISSVSRVMRGRCRMRQDTAERIAAALNCEIQVTLVPKKSKKKTKKGKR